MFENQFLYSTADTNTLAITVDNGLQGLYVDGVQIGYPTDANSQDWTKTSYYNIADTFQTIAIYGSDAGVIAGMLFSDDKGLLSDGRFKCISHLEDNW